MKDRGDRDLDRVAQRTYRYWYEDGIAEAATGVFFALIGFFLWASTRLTGPWILLWSLGLPISLIGGALGMRRLIGALKERLVYPRTGYVAYRRRSNWHRWAIGAGTAATMIALGSATRNLEIRLNLTVLVSALLVAAAFLSQSWRYGVLRLGLLAAASAGIGLAVAKTGAANEIAMARYFGAMGGCLLLSGLATLALYWRRTRPGPGGEGE